MGGIRYVFFDRDVKQFGHSLDYGGIFCPEKLCAKLLNLLIRKVGSHVHASYYKVSAESIQRIVYTGYRAGSRKCIFEY